MTKQEIFDYIVTHLRGMKERAGFHSHDTFSCLYLDGEGNRCAVGSLFPLFDIPDEVMKEMNAFSGNATNLSVVYGEFLPEWYINNDRFLKDLQMVHDSSGYWDKAGFSHRGEGELAAIANHHSLVYTARVPQ